MNDIEAHRQEVSITQYITEEDRIQYGLDRQDGSTTYRMEPSQFEALGSEIYDRVMNDGHTLVVGYGDVDFLKLVNSEFGHSGGDTIIEVVAHSIRQEADFAVRLGGDEFVFLAIVKSKDDAHIIEDRINSNMGQFLNSAEGAKYNNLGSGLSLGVACATAEDQISFKDLLAQADHNANVNKIEKVNSWSETDKQSLLELYTIMIEKGIKSADFIKFIAFIALEESLRRESDDPNN